jgi:hypothetical protein
VHDIEVLCKEEYHLFVINVLSFQNMAKFKHLGTQLKVEILR